MKQAGDKGCRHCGLWVYESVSGRWKHRATQAEQCYSGHVGTTPLELRTVAEPRPPRVGFSGGRRC